MRDRLPRAAKKRKIEQDEAESELPHDPSLSNSTPLVIPARYVLPRPPKAGKTKDILSRFGLDIWSVVMQQGIVEALDLLHLSRVNRSLRRVLMHASSQPVWHACFQSMKPPLPTLPDLVPPQLASLMFGSGCDVRLACDVWHDGSHYAQICGQDPSGSKECETYHDLRKRLCYECAKQNIVHEDELEDQLPELPVEVLQLVHVGQYQLTLRVREMGWKAVRQGINDYQGSPPSYFVPELLEWQDLFEQGDPVILQQRKKLITSLVKVPTKKAPHDDDSSDDEGASGDFVQQWRDERAEVKERERQQLIEAALQLEQAKVDKLIQTLKAAGISDDRIDDLNLDEAVHDLFWMTLSEKEVLTGARVPPCVCAVLQSRADADRESISKRIEALEMLRDDERQGARQQEAERQGVANAQRRHRRIEQVVEDWETTQPQSARDLMPSVNDLLANGTIASLALDSSIGDRRLSAEEERIIKDALPTAVAEKTSLIKAMLCSVQLGDVDSPISFSEQDAYLRQADTFWRCKSCRVIVSYPEVLRHHSNLHGARGPEHQFRVAQWLPVRAERRFAAQLLSAICKDTGMTLAECTWDAVNKLGTCWVYNGNVESLESWAHMVSTICNKQLHPFTLRQVTASELAHQKLDIRLVKRFGAVYRCDLCPYARAKARDDLTDHLTKKHPLTAQDRAMGFNYDLEATRLLVTHLDDGALQQELHNRRIERETNGCSCCICNDCSICLGDDVDEEMLGKHSLEGEAIET